MSANVTVEFCQMHKMAIIFSRLKFVTSPCLERTYTVIVQKIERTVSGPEFNCIKELKMWGLSHQKVNIRSDIDQMKTGSRSNKKRLLFHINFGKTYDLIINKM
jgi:hypothetical protein